MLNEELELAFADGRRGSIDRYVQPVGQHRDDSTRLLLRSADGRWFISGGEFPDASPIEMPTSFAAWLLDQPFMERLSESTIWLHPADLPRVEPTHRPHVDWCALDDDEP